MFIHKNKGILHLYKDNFNLDYIKIVESCPIPKIDGTLDHLDHSTIFNKIDLAGGYPQIEVHPDYN